MAGREASPQVRFRDLSSSSAVLLQVVFGRPLFLLPSDVYLRATLEMLVDSLRSTWPIPFHLLRLRIILAGSNAAEALIFSGIFFPIAYIGKYTAMIIVHFHLQPQFIYELFRIHITSFHSSREDMNSMN